MTFRDREKARYLRLKRDLFSAAAQSPGTYRGRARDFCLADGHSDENLYAGIRTPAIAYFAQRGIPWHDGASRHTLPSSHLCGSQVCCVNVLFPLASSPHLLTRVFRHVYPELAEALPVDSPLEPALPSGQQPCVAFEWTGEADHLAESKWRRAGGAPTRGANFTSADFLLRFRRADGRIHVVLGEWKYTETYGESNLAATDTRATDTRAASRRSGDVRLQTYRTPFHRPGGAFRDHAPDLYRALFYEPLYQLMRLQLLAQEMERAGELGAHVVSVLHVSPDANRELRTHNPSPQLRTRFPGMGALEVWQALVPADRFERIGAERLLAVIGREARATDPAWVDYLERRYGWAESTAGTPAGAPAGG